MESIYHIETDLVCRVLHYGTELCIAKPGQDVSISLRKGRHKLSFISTENTQDSYSIFYEAPENDIEDCIEVKLWGICRSRLIKEGKLVDLGLSVLWASCNLGASKPEEYGDYFAWGETEPKKYYYSANYKWFKGDGYTKYCRNKYDSCSGGSLDGKTVLDAEDDAARVNLGRSWRMPTDIEWAELQEKCRWVWTTRNGVTGCEVTGPNGNSIFLPAAGFWIDSVFCAAGSQAIYWSSSLGDRGFALMRYFYSSDVRWSRADGHRAQGHSVRPIAD